MRGSSETSGGCLCGAVRFTARFPSLFCAHVPRAQFALLRGAEDLVRYESSEHGSRSFCGRCGTSLFCESARYPDRMDVALGTTDGPIDREPQLHSYYDSRAPWVMIGDDLPRLGGKTGVDEEVTAVLHQGPVDGPRAAVRAAIVERTRSSGRSEPGEGGRPSG